MSALSKYRAALSACPAAGSGVHGWVMGTSNLAALAGVVAAEAVADITANMRRRPGPASEVLTAVEKAYRERGERVALGKCAPPLPKLTKPKLDPLTVAAFIARGAGLGEVDLWEASPVRLDWESGARDAVALLRALFLPGELVFCGDRYGQTVRPRDAWCERWEQGEPVPPYFIPNPLKRSGGQTLDGRPSARCDDAVAVFRYAVAEMDTLPLPSQFQFWQGWGLDAASAVTHSAGKSLHVLLRVDAADRAEWDAEVAGRLFDRYLVPWGCDKTCKNPSRLSRLAGASRQDKGGALQRLLYLREEMAA